MKHEASFWRKIQRQKYLRYSFARGTFPNYIYLNWVIFIITNRSFHMLSSINKLENIIHQDIGNRGIGKAWTSGALFKAAEVINRNNNIIILTGFYIPNAQTAETDGPTGAVALADAALSLNKSVTVVTGSHEHSIVKAGISASLNPNTKVVALNSKNEIHSFTKTIDKNSCIISIERPGRAKDGKYYSMSGTNITSYTSPIDEIILKNKIAKTIGIGDGGNEIGMGKIRKEILKHIDHGRKIASVIDTDILITAGVSNWGGYAVAMALQIINPNQHVATPTIESDHSVLRGIIDAGAVDGVTYQNTYSIDGFPYCNTHTDIIGNMRTIMDQKLQK